MTPELQEGAKYRSRISAAKAFSIAINPAFKYDTNAARRK